MEKNTLYIILGTLAGLVAGVIISSYAVNNRNYGMMNTMGMSKGMMQMMRADENSMMDEGEMHGSNMGMSMKDMSSLLATLRGDEFDQTFINLMIDHHQGAIDMAELVATNTERKELKELANDIITAQTKEIEMMKDWLDSWF